MTPAFSRREFVMQSRDRKGRSAMRAVSLAPARCHALTAHHLLRQRPIGQCATSGQSGIPRQMSVRTDLWSLGPRFAFPGTVSSMVS